MKKLLVVLCVMALALPVFGETVFRVGNGAEPGSLDPHLISGVNEARINDALFEGLVIPSPATGNPVPGVAEKWTVSPDGTVYTFTIRKGVRWSDGTPITARTVYESWLRNLDPATASEYASLMNDTIKGAKDYNAGKAGPDKVAMKVVDLQTFQVTLNGPLGYFPSALTHHAFAIVPIHAIKKYGADWTQPKNFVGNGPFKLKEWMPNDKIVCVKNPTYWDAKNVQLDQVVFYASDDNSVNYKMYVNGEIDWNTNSPPADKIDEAVARPQKDFLRTPILTVYYYEFNVNKPPFNDLRVRKAFSLSMGRKNIIDQITKTGELPTTNYVMPMGSYTGPKGIPEDIEAAKKLLADAGFPGGKGFPVVKLGYNTSSRHKSIAEYLQQQWEQVLGVKVEAQNMDFATFLDVRKDGNLGGFDIARAGWQADYMDPYDFLFMFLSDNKDFNDPRWANKQYDEMVRKSNTLPSGAERNKLFFDAETLLVEDLPIAPMFFYTSQNMIDLTKWSGWSSNSLDRHVFKYIFKK